MLWAFAGNQPTAAEAKQTTKGTLKKTRTDWNTACYNLLVSTREPKKCATGYACRVDFTAATPLCSASKSAPLYMRSELRVQQPKIFKKAKIRLKLLVLVPVRTSMYSLVNSDAVRIRPHACFTT